MGVHHALKLVCAFLQLSLLHCIRNPSKPLRQTVGTSIAVIVSLGTLKAWPELITACVQSLEGADLNALEGSLDALYKVSIICSCTAHGLLHRFTAQGLLFTA